MVARNKDLLPQTEQQIKDVDTEILMMLARRFELVKGLAFAKNLPEETIAYAPGSEALAIRSLMAQNNGVLEPKVLAKIWREIIAASDQLHCSFPIAVYTKEKPHEMMDLAKDYFGTDGHYSACVSIGQAIQKIDHGDAGVAVLPLFEHSEESWWTGLASRDHQDLKIVAKLPFVKNAGMTAACEAFVVSTVAAEETGLDRSLFVVEMSSQTSIGSLKNMFRDYGLAVNQVWLAHNLSRIYLFAVEMEGFVSETDERIVQFRTKNPQSVQMIRRIGGYAVQWELESK